MTADGTTGLNPYPDDSAVHVRYPLPGQGPHEEWPWLPGTIVQRCGPDEWQVVVQAPELAEEEDGEVTYPLCFRDASELLAVSGAPPVP